MLVVAALVLGLALGLVLAYSVYALELRRIGDFLRSRDRSSGARVMLGSVAPGLRGLADAVNAELDAASEAHVEAERRAAEFRRDLSSLSHDIRTPLMGAKGFLELAREEGDPARRGELLESAVGRLDDVQDLLDQLFAYAKASDPDLSLRWDSVDVQALVADVLVGHYPEFEGHGWEPDVRLGDAPAMVEADADQLRRIVENLVTNALRYGADAPAVELGRGEGRVTLVVSNRVTDPGSIDVERLFDRFYQADSARGGKGAGLGLSVCAKLAEAMGMGLSASLDGDALAISFVMASA